LWSVFTENVVSVSDWKCLLDSLGSVVLARYSDDKWYRAAVTRLLGHQVEVELTDFGSIICVSASDGFVVVVQ